MKGKLNSIWGIAFYITKISNKAVNRLLESNLFCGEYLKEILVSFIYILAKSRRKDICISDIIKIYPVKASIDWLISLSQVMIRYVFPEMAENLSTDLREVSNQQNPISKQEIINELQSKFEVDPLIKQIEQYKEERKNIENLDFDELRSYLNRLNSIHKELGASIFNIKKEDIEGENFQAIIADIFVNDERRSLEVGTGFMNPMYVIEKNSEGTPYLTRGGVMTYYEFLSQVNEVLTNEEWRERLQSGTNPSQPEWANSFTATSNDTK
ncbi:MAG: DUF3160 domain-containing protein [Candidatus Hodarchaeales archaeon]|jgi:hypothetical protein